jgi:hypothetical protein
MSNSFVMVVYGKAFGREESGTRRSKSLAKFILFLNYAILPVVLCPS